jgi:hypothetical protein
MLLNRKMRFNMTQILWSGFVRLDFVGPRTDERPTFNGDVFESATPSLSYHRIEDQMTTEIRNSVQLRILLVDDNESVRRVAHTIYSLSRS